MHQYFHQHEQFKGNLKCCPLEVDEVCGKSGITYKNKCFLNSYKDDTFAHKGKCKNPAPIRMCFAPCQFEKYPVCGVTGMTYMNNCHLTCGTNDIKAYEGKCNYCQHQQNQHDNQWPQDNNPVCSMSNHTFTNLCMLEKNGQKLKHKGKCNNNTKKIICPKIKKQVCGINGKTYYNECFLKKKQIKIKHEGKCIKKEQCSCSQKYDPVCGNDGKTYNNICYLQCSQVQQKHRGECLVVPEKCFAITCPTFGKPVCGKTGITYKNMCLLECAGDKFDKNGECKEKDHCEQQKDLEEQMLQKPEYCNRIRCSTLYEPVCGKIRHLTYRNSCLMSCIVGDIIKHKGECEPVKHCLITFEYDPVCGVNGKTYSNLSALACDRMDLWRKGKCQQDDNGCPEDYDPVCGSNNKTYSNLCKLEKSNYEFKHMGKCRKKRRNKYYHHSFETKTNFFDW